MNCPFDEEYQPLFRAMIFAIEFCGFEARSALEVDDAGETRIEKIIRIIRESRFGVHDISRTDSNEHGLPRFNMPYEFGIFTGLKHSSEPWQRKKALLVLDREKYRYQRFLSDIAGQDIRSHGNDPGTLISQLRNWLQNQTNRNLVGGHFIRGQFATFREQLPELLIASHMTEHDLDNFTDYRRFVFNWIKQGGGN